MIKPQLNKYSVIEEYRDILVNDSMKARQLIKKLDFQRDPYLLSLIAQTYIDEARFDNNNKQRRRLLMRKWYLAEKYIIKAYKLDSSNAEIIYKMGTIRRVYGRDDLAIYCYKRVSKMDPKSIAKGEYNRGIAFAWELINDSRFELYRLYFDTHPLLSKRYLELYKKGLKRGINTIYSPLEDFLLE